MDDHRARHTTARVIPGLAGTATHDLGIVVYQAHYNTGNGFCAQCGKRHSCPSWRGAVEIIAAAGDDPRRYDEPLTRYASAPTRPPPGEP
jgi:hypothetical protein